MGFIQPPWPSLSSKEQVQTVANQGREGMQRQGRSSQESIVHRVPFVVQWLKNPTRNHGVAGFPWPCSVGWGSGVAVSYGVGHRHDLAQILRCCGSGVGSTAPIGPLARGLHVLQKAASEKAKRHTHTHKKKESIVQDWGRVLVPPQGIHIMMQASYTPKRKVIFRKLLLEMKSSETNSYNWIIWSPFLCFSKHNRTLNTIAYELKIRCS